MKENVGISPPTLLKRPRRWRRRPRSQRSGAVMSAQTQTKGFLMSASTMVVLAALGFRWGYALARRAARLARCDPALHDTSPCVSVSARHPFFVGRHITVEFEFDISMGAWKRVNCALMHSDSSL